MAREECFPRERAPSFEAARRWRTWREWPGFMGLATALALWVFVVTGVLAPLADALARFRSPALAPQPGCVVPGDAPFVDEPAWAPHPRASVLARRATSCLPAAPVRDEDLSRAAEQRPSPGKPT
jgi:hypothetical protein